VADFNTYTLQVITHHIETLEGLRNSFGGHHKLEGLYVAADTTR
jgi:hypothetical protein